MHIQRASSFHELLAKLIFLVVPTAAIGYFFINEADSYFAILQNDAVRQSLYFGAGMALSLVFYTFRFRFLPSFLLLAGSLYSIYLGLDKYAGGEFDSFFISIQFRVFSLLLLTGWLLGWAFSRIRYASVFIAAAFLTGSMALIAKQKATTVEGFLFNFSPALLYAVYLVFATEQIYAYKEKSLRFWWFLSRRMIAFAILALLLFRGIVFLLDKQIKETVANYGGQGKEGKNSLLKKNKDGSFDLEDYTKLRGSLGRNNDLLFCAHIDNYFPGTDFPNPLYLTAFYYTKFDTSTETFERDATIPKNDLFEPDPSKLPLFFTKTDSSVIQNSLGDKLRKTVDVEVYCKSLSPSTYLAPSTGFFVQPIAIEKDFRKEFKTAFRTKSYVSELNSAYFIYNSDEKQIRNFQEQRFELLRKVKGYEGTDSAFFKYYTYMPRDAKFQNIAKQATEITENAITPVDKVLAIRDWFLSKDENGDPLFKYTDNPGIPDIPSASKLMYFMFENRKGYCAYYAGATLFLLRSLGIPSRITVGFLTVDRSDKNKGWYWYYADQAHAWVQVYFPGYGWLDFDTTVGNSDAEESPKPDGTPPMQPPRAWLAADGVVENIDTVKKRMQFHIKHFVFHDKEYLLKEPQSIEMDLKVAVIRIDSVEVPLASIQKGDVATAVSYAEAFKKIETGKETGMGLIKKFPDPAPIDEVYLKRMDTSKPEEKLKEEKKAEGFSFDTFAIRFLLILGIAILFALLSPLLVLFYFKIRHKYAGTVAKPYWVYRIATYYLHQCGIGRNFQTPMQYARLVVDPTFGTSFTTFMNIYLKQKYSKQVLSQQELEWTEKFLPEFIRAINSKLLFRKRFWGFMNPLIMIGFFLKPETEGK